MALQEANALWVFHYVLKWTLLGVTKFGIGEEWNRHRYLGSGTDSIYMVKRCDLVEKMCEEFLWECCG